MGIMETMLPVCKVGESDYYFTVNKNRPDLLRELDTAMMSIQDEDPHFNQRILERVHIKRASKIIANMITERKIESSLS